MKFPIVLYDDQCSLCARFKQSVEKIDRTHFLTFISVHNKEIYNQFPILIEAECLKKIHIIQDDQTIYAGKDALEFMITQLPEIKKFAWLIENQMGQKALEIFHDTANLLRRKLLKRCPTCNHK